MNSIIIVNDIDVNYKLLGAFFMFDFHMHSDFSEDCFTPMENTIESAIAKGFKQICFTEHVDYDYPDPDFTFDLDTVAYERKIREMQQKYSDQITIKKGIEIGIQPHLFERYHKLLNNETFDFIICSMHAADRKDLHNGDFFEGRTPEEAYQYYYEELLYCVERFDHYSILGHIDLVKRYKKLDTNNNFHDIIGEIFKTIIPKGKGIEVNTSGFAYGLESAMPSRDILELYFDLGGEIITVGSDAHKPEHVGHRFDEIFKMLHDIGFQYVATFSEKEPTFHKIEKLL